MSGRGLRAFILAALFFASLASHARPLFVPEYGYSLDLPSRWVAGDSSDPAHLSFSDSAHGDVLECSIFAHNGSPGAAGIGRNFAKGLAAEETGQISFLFSGRDAYLSQISFENEGTRFQGYILAVGGLRAHGAEKDLMLIAFTPATVFSKEGDALLSALDSFSPDEEGRLQPGAISQSLLSFPVRDRTRFILDFPGGSIDSTVGRGEPEATQALIEREARVLVGYTAGDLDAWRRYYRMIYRDSFHRLDDVSSSLMEALRAMGVSPDRYPAEILSWIQGFTYTRTGTLSDFLSPLSTVFHASGDCDSRAILYAALLDHLGMDALLFVSLRYSHALAGVAMDGPGASLDVEGRRYVVAEMTQQVPLGMIAKDIADASAWIPMPLRERSAVTAETP